MDSWFYTRHKFVSVNGLRGVTAPPLAYPSIAAVNATLLSVGKAHLLCLQYFMTPEPLSGKIQGVAEPKAVIIKGGPARRGAPHPAQLPRGDQERLGDETTERWPSGLPPPPQVQARAGRDLTTSGHPDPSKPRPAP